MKRFRISLMTLALGLAAVYMWNGMSIATDTIPVNLPKVNSNEDVLFIQPSTAKEVNWQWSPKEIDILNGRDLSTYQVSPPIESCDQFERQVEIRRCIGLRQGARGQILKNWNVGRKSYFEIRHPCIDCSPVSHVFVEPDNAGRWHVVTTDVSSGVFGTSVRTTEAAFLKFRRATEDEQWRTYSKTVLSFLDRNGNEINYF